MTDEQPRGIMLEHPEKKEVPITSRNSIFFPTMDADGRPVMVYQGTGLVASMLEAMEDCKQASGKEATCAFFDISGEFYDDASLKGLTVCQNGETKHTARFELDGAEITIPADNIYCLGGSAVSAEVALLEPAQQDPGQDQNLAA